MCPIIAAAEAKPVHFMDCLGVSLVRMINEDLVDAKVKKERLSSPTTGDENKARKRQCKTTMGGNGSKQNPLLLE